MRIANVGGRLKLLVAGGAVDVERASQGHFGPQPAMAFEYFDDLAHWSGSVSVADEPFVAEAACAPSPCPRQVFAVGLNYLDHAAESGFSKPSQPVVFTKYASSFAGPVSEVVLPSGFVDWEVELVAIIGRTSRHVRADRAWASVAGLALGQDLSERHLQRQGPAPQFGLAKSFPGFSPFGPCLVTPDELDDPDDIALGCDLNGEEMQKARTAEMLFPVGELVAYLSSVVTLLPGDVVFTGTPPGVGIGRTPPRYLAPGDHLHSWAEGIGELHQRLVCEPSAPRGDA